MSPRDFFKPWTEDQVAAAARVIYPNRCLALLRHSSSLPPAMDEQPIADTSRLRGTVLSRAGIHGLTAIRRAACHVAMTPGGLLPHLFHHCLLSRPAGTELLAGCYFLSRYSAVTDGSLLEKVWCSVLPRTFLFAAPELTSIGKRHKRPATIAKVTNKFQEIFA